jgi:hypothetical protein
VQWGREHLRSALKNPILPLLKKIAVAKKGELMRIKSARMKLLIPFTRGSGEGTTKKGKSVAVDIKRKSRRAKLFAR